MVAKTTIAMNTINLISQLDNYHLLTGRTPTMLNRFLSLRLKAHGFDLTREQWSILAVLWNGDGCSQQHLANATYRDKPSTTRLLDNLEKEGYIVRKGSEHDRRTNLIFLTEKGQKIEKPVTRVIYQVLDDATKGLSEQDIRLLKSYFDKIFNNIMLQIQ